MPKYRILTENEEKEIIDLYSKNTLRMTAKKFGTSTKKVEQVLNKNHIILHTEEEEKVIKHLNHVAGFASMSESAKSWRAEAISDKLKSTYSNYTEEQKLAFSKMRSQVEAKKSAEYKQDIFERGKQTQIEKWKNKTKEEKKLHSEKTKSGLAKLTNEDKLLIQKKRESTTLKNFGVINPLKNKNILNKINATKRKNNTFNASSQEELFYNYLLIKYNEKDIIRQYSDARYPFQCDFYVKSEDLFIELNLSWTHGRHAFNKDAKEDIMLLETWKAKDSKYYKNAIETWTVRDVKKQQIAKENNLNYKAIYWDEWKQIESEIKSYVTD